MDRDSNFDFSDFLLDEKLYKEKYENILMTFHTKLQRVQNHCASSSIK